MSTLAAPAPSHQGVRELYRFSVPEYLRMVEDGILVGAEHLELIEGYVVVKMTKNTPHEGGIDLVRETLSALLPRGWMLRCQQALVLPDSVPEPDFAVVRGSKRTYLRRHPAAADAGLVIEVADSSLDHDRTDKARIYARAGIPTYWIVNVAETQLEVYTQPSGPAEQPAYGQRIDLKPGDTVELVLDGGVVATVPVAELLP